MKDPVFARAIDILDDKVVDIKRSLQYDHSETIGISKENADTIRNIIITDLKSTIADLENAISYLKTADQAPAPAIATPNI